MGSHRNRLDMWIRALNVFRTHPAYAAKRLVENCVHNPIASRLIWSLRHGGNADAVERFMRRDWDRIRQQQEACLNAECCSVRIEIEEYDGYLSRAKYPRGYAGKGFAEKTLEHFLSAKYLDICHDDVYVDVASASSPFPHIVKRVYNCRVYTQDLAYRAGIHGYRIGGDACNMPLPDCSVSKMTLHCSLEHFEEDSDTLFVREAARVLKTGGKLCIIPLYLAETYTIFTDPTVNRRGVKFDRDAIVVDVFGFRNRFGRQYSAQKFKERIVNAAPSLSLQLLYVENEKEIDESCYVKFIALFEKK